MLGFDGPGSTPSPGSRRHASCLHRDVAEYRRGLADFFAEGLQDELRLAYVSSDGVEAARADLADLGDLDGLLATGALHVLSARDMYGAGGPVDPERVVAFVAAATEQAVADGFCGLAVSADATELVGTPAHQDAFARYELLVDRYMAGHPLSALCGYGLTLGNDTVAEFALLHTPTRSHEAPLQVFGCADGAVGLAGEWDPVGVATLGRLLPRLRTAVSAESPQGAAGASVFPAQAPARWARGRAQARSAAGQKPVFGRLEHPSRVDLRTGEGHPLGSQRGSSAIGTARWTW